MTTHRYLQNRLASIAGGVVLAATHGIAVGHVHPDTKPDMHHGSTDGTDHGAMQDMSRGVQSDAVPVGSLPTSDGTTSQNYAGYGIRPHLMEDAVSSSFVLDKFGLAYDRAGKTGFQWDGEFWIGRDLNKLWIKSEGSRVENKTDGKVEAFWSHVVSPFWDVQLGARRDFGKGASRNWAAIGVQGTAPYNIDTQITTYVGGSGRTALALKAEYDLLFTQRLILTPTLEASWYGKNDKARGIGSGLSNASLAVRLRYEMTREIAPYIGVSFGRKLGNTARYASEHGESRSERAILAGVRIQF